MTVLYSVSLHIISNILSSLDNIIHYPKSQTNTLRSLSLHLVRLRTGGLTSNCLHCCAECSLSQMFLCQRCLDVRYSYCSEVCRYDGLLKHSKICVSAAATSGAGTEMKSAKAAVVELSNNEKEISLLKNLPRRTMWLDGHALHKILQMCGGALTHLSLVLVIPAEISMKRKFIKGGIGDLETQEFYSDDICDDTETLLNSIDEALAATSAASGGSLNRSFNKVDLVMQKIRRANTIVMSQDHRTQNSKFTSDDSHAGTFSTSSVLA